MHLVMSGSRTHNITGHRQWFLVVRLNSSVVFMMRLTATECLCHKYTRYVTYLVILSSFMTFHRIRLKIRFVTWVTRRVSLMEERLLPSKTSKFIPVFLMEFALVNLLVFCVVFYRIWQLHCTSVFDLRLLTTIFISASFSYTPYPAVIDTTLS